MTAHQPATSRGPLLAIAAIVDPRGRRRRPLVPVLPPGRPRPRVPRPTTPTQVRQRDGRRRPASDRSAPATPRLRRADRPTAAETSDGIAGTWTVDPTVGSFSDFSGSFVGYRVQETLASASARPRPSAGRRT